MSNAAPMQSSNFVQDRENDATLPTAPNVADLYARNIDSEAKKKLLTHSLDTYLSISRDLTSLSDGQDSLADVKNADANTHIEINKIDDKPLPEILTTKASGKPRRVVTFFPIQEWDGHVIEINSESFRARLVDITDLVAKGEKEVEIPFSELDEESQKLLTEGRLFRWSIGYQRSPGGQKTRVSRIIVRRLPAWQAKDIDAAHAEAVELSQDLKWK